MRGPVYFPRCQPQGTAKHRWHHAGLLGGSNVAGRRGTWTHRHVGLEHGQEGQRQPPNHSQKVGKMEPSVEFSLETCRQSQSMWPQEGVGLAPGHPGRSPHFPTICTICGTQQAALGREPGSAGWVGERENGDRAELVSGTQVLDSFCLRSRTLNHHHTKWPCAGGSQKLLGLVARGGDKSKTVRRMGDRAGTKAYILQGPALVGSEPCQEWLEA